MNQIISIALATYNGERYLKSQLDSFLDQTLQPDELIVSDDHSTDNTLQIVKDFKDKASFDVKILENESNEGYSANFEKAISQTKGDLIFFSDQDDQWSKNKIESFVKKYEMSRSHLLVCNRLHVDKEMAAIENEDSISRCRRLGIPLDSYGPGCAMMITRQFKEFVIPIPRYKDSAYDTWVNDLALMIDSRVLIPEILQKYRVNEESSSQHIIGTKIKSNRMNFLFFKWKKTKSNGRVDSVHLYDLQEQRAIDQKEWIKKNSPKRFDEILESLKDLKNHYRTKFNIKKRSYFGRLPLIYNGIKNGAYSHKGGVSSFIKDLIIP